MGWYTRQLVSSTLGPPRVYGRGTGRFCGDPASFARFRPERFCVREGRRGQALLVQVAACVLGEVYKNATAPLYERRALAGLQCNARGYGSLTSA